MDTFLQAFPKISVHVHHTDVANKHLECTMRVGLDCDHPFDTIDMSKLVEYALKGELFFFWKATCPFLTALLLCSPRDHQRLPSGQAIDPTACRGVLRLPTNLSPC